MKILLLTPFFGHTF